MISLTLYQSDWLYIHKRDRERVNERDRQTQTYKNRDRQRQRLRKIIYFFSHFSEERKKNFSLSSLWSPCLSVIHIDYIYTQKRDREIVSKSERQTDKQRQAYRQTGTDRNRDEGDHILIQPLHTGKKKLLSEKFMVSLTLYLSDRLYIHKRDREKE